MPDAASERRGLLETSPDGDGSDGGGGSGYGHGGGGSPFEETARPPRGGSCRGGRDGGRDDCLAPVPEAARTWSAWTYVAMWVGITIQPSSFVFGAALLASGLGISGCALALTVGNLLLLGPLCLNGIPGTRHGIPFPIALRRAFGGRGAALPVVIRGLVGVGWGSFNLYVGSDAIYKFIANVAPATCANAPRIMAELNAVQAACFVVFLGVHCGAACAGPARLRPLLKTASGIQSVGALALCAWAFSVAPVGAIARTSDELRGNTTTTPAQQAMSGMTATCSGWSTLVLNIADLSRFARSEEEFVRGQLLAFPVLNIGMPLLGVVVFAAAKHAYPSAITAEDWTLTALFELWPWPAAFAGTLVYVLSVFTTNCTANLLSAANDASSVFRGLSFRGGFLLALGVATALCPWATFRSADGFINQFLVGIGMFTGGILGVMLAEYWVVGGGSVQASRPAIFDGSAIADLYRDTTSCHWLALAAMLCGPVLCLPGYILSTCCAKGWGSPWVVLYTFSWPLATVVGGLLYTLGVGVRTGKLKDRLQFWSFSDETVEAPPPSSPSRGSP